ncbi:hypothetical protein PPROV_000426500 [Pycnococcus provasolii]|uniref:Uncharacterized protein n=1 Tax=Pycnococcus provasolii TaxID=41880 RepID=A0A830HET9_9CHLO|nr:hypothetical protein PPROV_000426500 [Pycnococcus provasolii]
MSVFWARLFGGDGGDSATRPLLMSDEESRHKDWAWTGPRRHDPASSSSSSVSSSERTYTGKTASSSSASASASQVVVDVEQKNRHSKTPSALTDPLLPIDAVQVTQSTQGSKQELKAKPYHYVLAFGLVVAGIAGLVLAVPPENRNFRRFGNNATIVQKSAAGGDELDVTTFVDERTRYGDIATDDANDAPTPSGDDGAWTLPVTSATPSSPAEEQPDGDIATDDANDAPTPSGDDGAWTLPVTSATPSSPAEEQPDGDIATDDANDAPTPSGDDGAWTLPVTSSTSLPVSEERPDPDSGNDDGSRQTSDVDPATMAAQEKLVDELNRLRAEKEAVAEAADKAEEEIEQLRRERAEADRRAAQARAETEAAEELAKIAEQERLAMEEAAKKSRQERDKHHSAHAEDKGHVRDSEAARAHALAIAASKANVYDGTEAKVARDLFESRKRSAKAKAKKEAQKFNEARSEVIHVEAMTSNKLQERAIAALKNARNQMENRAKQEIEEWEGKARKSVRDHEKRSIERIRKEEKKLKNLQKMASRMAHAATTQGLEDWHEEKKGVGRFDRTVHADVAAYPNKKSPKPKRTHTRKEE